MDEREGEREREGECVCEREREIKLNGLIENESEARSKNGEYFKNFFDGGNFKSYMMSSNESSNLIKIKGTNKISVNVKINYNSLRKDLEQNRIIRKFGY